MQWRKTFSPLPVAVLVCVALTFSTRPATAAAQEEIILESGIWVVARTTDRLTQEPVFLLEGHPTEVEGLRSGGVTVVFSSDRDPDEFVVTHDLSGELDEVNWRVGDNPVRRALYAVRQGDRVVVEDDQFLADLLNASTDAEVVLRISGTDTEATLALPASGFAQAFASYEENAPTSVPRGPSAAERCGPLLRDSVAAGSWSDEFLESDCLVELGPEGLAALLAPEYRVGPNRSSDSPPSATPTPSEGKVTASKMAARFTERNNTWWRWAYQVTLVNTSSERVTLGLICVKAADSDGFTIDSAPHRGVSLAPNGSHELDGFILIDASVAPNVEKIGVGSC